MSKSLFPVKKIKLNAAGEQIADDATDHVAVLLPDFGLVFTRKPINDAEAPQKELEELAPKHELLGYKWDLPEIYELQLVVDFSRRSPALDPAFFDVPLDWLWSKTELAGNPAAAWCVSSSSGDSSYYLRVSRGFALAVARVGQ